MSGVRLSVSWFCLIVLLTSGLAAAEAGPQLMAPTGPYRVGTVTYDWTDPSRLEGATEDPDDRRRVVVQIWYPADAVGKEPRAPYVYRLDAYRATTDEALIDMIATVATNSFENAPLSGAEPRYPVLLFSHGWNGSRSFNSTLLEDPASHGYVVVGVDHPYMGEVAMDDGTVILANDDHFASSIDAAEEYAADQLFVIEKLAELDASDPLFSGRLDMNRVATSGHSSGFPAAAWAAAVDRRVAACISFDAGLQKTAAEFGLSQPVLLFRAEAGSYTSLFDRDPDTYEKGSIFPRDFFNNHESDFHDVVIAGTTHGSFGDWPTLFAETEEEKATARAQRAETRAYIVAFLDRYLKNREPALLAGASGKRELSVRTTYRPDPGQVAFRHRLDAVVTQVASDHDVPGLSVALVRNGEVVYGRSLGVSNIDAGGAVTCRSLFHMASVTKTFVGIALMQLAERGKIDLDARIVDYLPYFELTDRRYRDITVRQMMSHTSGMPDVLDYEWENPSFDDGALEEYVRGIADQHLIADPGEVFSYSNMAYEVLGDVIAKVSGQSFEDYVEEAILGPLAMKSSRLMVRQANQRLVTTPHLSRLDGGVRVSGVFPYNRKHAPSSTLVSNTFEMTQIARALLNGGELNGKRILQAASIDAMWSPQMRDDVGLSWFFSKRHGERVVSHDGHDRGFRSYLALIPKRQMAVVVSSNYDAAPVVGLGRAVLDVALGFTPELPPEPLLKQFRRFDGTPSDFYQRLSCEQNVRERGWNLFGYQLIQTGNVAAAIVIFKENVAQNPDSWNVYDSLAEAYLLDGQLDVAEQNYRKSLSLNPNNTNAVEMLKQIDEKRQPLASGTDYYSREG